MANLTQLTAEIKGVAAYIDRNCEAPSHRYLTDTQMALKWLKQARLRGLEDPIGDEEALQYAAALAPAARALLQARDAYDRIWRQQAFKD